VAIALQSVVVRHERRLRLVFTNSLAGGAFGVPAPSYYAIENTDGLGTDPTISAAMIVANSPQVVELALGIDLVPNAQYKVTAVGVPAVDATVTPSGTEDLFRFGQPTKGSSVEERAVLDRERLLYFTDLLWNGIDFQETPTADLDRVTGTANVSKALWRGIEADGLPWNRNWGGKARQFVDSPSLAGGSLRGSVVSHVLTDPRVRSAKSDIEIEETSTYLHITPTLVTGETLLRQSVKVPNG
jgi:hypothetical protein